MTAPASIPVPPDAKSSLHTVSDASIYSVTYGIVGLVVSLLFVCWSMYLASVDLGENDFSGLFLLLSQVGLFGVSATFAAISLVTGLFALISSFRNHRPKTLACVGIALGSFSTMCLLYVFYL
jgi:hypothetical protein